VPFLSLWCKKSYYFRPVKILVLTSRFPFPLEKGDKLRIYHQMRELSRAGHDIVLVALADEPVLDNYVEEIKQFCSQIYVFRLTKLVVFSNVFRNILRGCSLPFQIAYFFNSAIKNQIKQIIDSEKPDHIYCHLVRASEYVKDVDLPKTLDFMDAFGAGTERRAAISSLFLRPFWYFEARLMLNYEKRVAPFFSNLTIISEQDRERLPISASSVTVVGNGVDIDFFNLISFDKKKAEILKRNLELLSNDLKLNKNNSNFNSDLNRIEYIDSELKSIENELNHNGNELIDNGNDAILNKSKTDLVKKYDVCFVGNLGYYSNVEAVRYLIKKILPILKAAKPDIKILIAGARPTTEIQYLGDENVTVLGWLDDIREAYAASRILVAPLMHGIGQQNKILEAMAMHVPVVSTSRVNNAIGAVPESDILIADTEGVFAEQILRLLQSIDLQTLIANNGRAFVEKKYSWQGATMGLNGLISKR
jgi:glycosyltransferase involved in cell wall biosynthesis